MWHVIALVLASASPPSGQGLTVKGTAFGPRKRLVCEWFTNFENSRLERCRIGTKPVADFEDGASIECLGQICAQLDAEARRITHWNKPEAVWGRFTVAFDGRVSVGRREKRYLGDGTRSVLIERLVSLQKR